MGKITVVNLPEMTLWYHRDKRIVHHQMHRYPGTTVLENVLEQGLATLRENGGVVAEVFSDQFQALAWLVQCPD